MVTQGRYPVLGMIERPRLDIEYIGELRENSQLRHPHASTSAVINRTDREECGMIFCCWEEFTHLYFDVCLPSPSGLYSDTCCDMRAFLSLAEIICILCVLPLRDVDH